MGLEVATFINELVITNPVGATDPKSQGDDHLRLLKSTIKNSFTGVTGAVTASQAELNILDGATLSTAELNILDGVTLTAANINNALIKTDATHILTNAAGPTLAFHDSNADTSEKYWYQQNSSGTFALGNANDSLAALEVAYQFVSDAGVISTGLIHADALTITGDATVTVNGATTLASAVSCSSTLGVTGTTTAAAINASGNIAITKATALLTVNATTGDASAFIDADGATNNAYSLYRSDTADCYVGVAGTTDALVTGATHGDLVLRCASQDILFTADSGTTVHLEVDSSVNITGGARAATCGSGSFTGTLTGYASGPTGTVQWRRSGNEVTLFLTSNLDGTSNADTMTMTGLPAAVQPASGQSGPSMFMEDSGSGVSGAFFVSSSTITFYVLMPDINGRARPNSTGFVTSGTKGLLSGWAIRYQVA